MADMNFGVNLLPVTTATYSIGSSSKKWQINGVSDPQLTDTTYNNLTAAENGTALSLVTTGEKYIWNHIADNKVLKNGDTMTGDLIAPRVRIGDIYYGVLKGTTSSRFREIAIYTGIKISNTSNIIYLQGNTPNGTIHLCFSFATGSTQDFNNIVSRVISKGEILPTDIIIYPYTLENVDYFGISLYFYGSQSLSFQINLQDNTYSLDQVELSQTYWTFTTYDNADHYNELKTGTFKKPTITDLTNPSTVNGYTVGKNVPSNAVFTDTTYTFENGTNSFTVTPSNGTAQTVTVTPSITDNITGSGSDGYLVKFNGTNTITNGPQLGNDTTKFLRNDGTWAIALTSHQDISGKVNKSGDTMTGDLIIRKESPNVGVQDGLNFNDSTFRMNLFLNSSSGVHGLWSSGYFDGTTFTDDPKSMIYRNSTGEIIVNGRASENAIIVASGTQSISSAPTSSSNLTITFSPTLADTNYIVIATPNVNSINVGVQQKQTNNFKLFYKSNTGSTVTNAAVNWAILKL